MPPHQLRLQTRRAGRFRSAPRAGRRDAAPQSRALTRRAEEHPNRPRRAGSGPGKVETVRRMYRMFTLKGLPERAIAAELNAEGSRTDLGRPWTRGTVHQVLTNEKYIGNNVFNRTSFKLKQRRVRNPPGAWVRAERGVFEPIVEPDFFYGGSADRPGFIWLPGGALPVEKSGSIPACVLTSASPYAWPRKTRRPSTTTCSTNRSRASRPRQSGRSQRRSARRLRFDSLEALFLPGRRHELGFFSIR